MKDISNGVRSSGGCSSFSALSIEGSYKGDIIECASKLVVEEVMHVNEGSIDIVVEDATNLFNGRKNLNKNNKDQLKVSTTSCSKTIR